MPVNAGTQPLLGDYSIDKTKPSVLCSFKRLIHCGLEIFSAFIPKLLAMSAKSTSGSPGEQAMSLFSSGTHSTG
jgi:hypothetical protein